MHCKFVANATICEALFKPIKIHLDNTGSIASSITAKFHNHSKHIDLHYHGIRHHINKKCFILQ
jgi:hypothetical protein